MNVDLVVNVTGSSPGYSNFWDLGYVYVSKPGSIVVKGECEQWEVIEKKGAPGGEFIPHYEYGGPTGEYFYGLGNCCKYEKDPSLDGVEEGLSFWDPEKESLADLIDLKVASTCEYMRRVGEGVPEWVEVADRRQGDVMVPCVVLEGGAIVYPKSPKCELIESMACGEDTGVVAPPYAWSSSGPPNPRRMWGMFGIPGSGVVSEDLLKSAIHVIKIASKCVKNHPAEAAEADDDASSENPTKRKADTPATNGEKAAKKKSKTTSTSSPPSARSPVEVVDLTKEDDA